MSKADDVFIRQFIIILVLLAAYGVGAAVLGIWIAADARDVAAGSERATLERIAPVGRLKVGEPGQRARAGAAGSESEAGSSAAGSSGTAPAADASGATTVVAAVSSSGGGRGSAAAGGEVGEAIYKKYCFACHMTGVAEAPRTGDTEAWAPRAAEGFDTLYKTVINGKGAMPPRAGFPHLSDDELKAGIRYLLAAANVAAE